MTELRRAAEQALEALEEACEIVGAAWAWRDEKGKPSITALRERLAQPEQEPVATVVKRQYEDGTYAGNALDWTGRNSEDDFPVGTKLYTAPPKREWISLTDEEIYAPWPLATRIDFARWVEAKLKEKNA